MSYTFQAGCRRTLVVWLAVVLPMIYAGSSQADQPPWSLLEQQIDQHFSTLPNWQPEDIISRSEVVGALQHLRTLKWTPEDAQEIADSALAEDDFLIEQLRTTAGRRFMRKISNQKLVFDQLDRIADESGGKALIRHLIRLPDGEQFIEADRPVTTPGLLELLPKKGSGKTRKVRDFEKPTKKIYTAEQLKERLHESYEKQGR